MKTLNHQFLTDAEAQNSVLTNLREQLAPLSKHCDETEKLFETKRKEYENAIAVLITQNIALNSNVTVDMDNHGMQMEINVFHPKYALEENKQSWHPSFQIDLVNRIENYWDDEKKARVNIGDIEEFGRNVHTHFDIDEPDTQLENLELLIVLGTMAQWAKQNTAEWQTIQLYFKELAKLLQQIQDTTSKIQELHKQIKIEQLAIIKFEVEMHLQADNSILEIEKYEKTSYTNYPVYSWHKTDLTYINSVARTTCHIFERTADADYSEEKPNAVPNEWSYGRETPRQNIETLLEKLTKKSIVDDYIIILLSKEETQKILKMQSGKLTDKKFLKEITGIMDAETELVKETEKVETEN